MSEQPNTGNLTLEELRGGMESGEFHTVLLAMVDMQGRLQGKRLTVEHFVDEVVKHNAEGCNYQLAVDIEMNPVSGYRHASWSTGYGDFVFVPDLSTLRRIPWHHGTALVMCDLAWEDGTPVAVSPRQILQRQIDRLAERGLEAHAGTELEFIVFRDSYEEAWHQAYRDLMPANLYNVDYALLDTACLEPLLGRIRNEMRDAGLHVEDSKGECNLGQHEINFHYGPVLATADGHSIYKNGAKEIAAQEDHSLTFMPKFNEREGNSCHIHLSVRTPDGKPVMADGHDLSEQGRHFVAGLLAGMRDLTLFLAPNINSYKRYVEGSFAPTAVAWGRDNRTCSLRLVGHDQSLRVENRVPGGDVNPYLALAAMIAAGIHGMENRLELEEPFNGNAYEADKPRVPDTLRDARDLFAASPIAKEAFGEDVVEHYLNMAKVELDAFNAAVTDWERFRGFERM
ncbi:MAG: glutamine synthetase family protein [Halofilum sp. (in: g-proteobacteria)]|nr:glutamine synthetase family protein [Halofilum sp. (in: g-proteobacteria)]